MLRALLTVRRQIQDFSPPVLHDRASVPHLGDVSVDVFDQVVSPVTNQTMASALS